MDIVCEADTMALWETRDLFSYLIVYLFIYHIYGLQVFCHLVLHPVASLVDIHIYTFLASLVTVQSVQSDLFGRGGAATSPPLRESLHRLICRILPVLDLNNIHFFSVVAPDQEEYGNNSEMYKLVHPCTYLMKGKPASTIVLAATSLNNVANILVSSFQEYIYFNYIFFIICFGDQFSFTSQVK